MSRVLTGMIIVASLAANAPLGWAQGPIWLRQFGTADEDSVFALAPDDGGGVFAAGKIGTISGSSFVRGALLARYDEIGNQIWIRHTGIRSQDVARAACLESAGGVFVAGSSYDANVDRSNFWLALHNRDGTPMWIREMAINVTPTAICPDGAGGVFVAGYTLSSFGGPNAGGYDVWLARYDGATNRLWVRGLGTSRDEAAFALCPDAAGGVFIAGSTDGSLGGPFAGGVYDPWVALYDSAGNRTWLRQFGTGANDFANSLCPDGAGGAYVGGITNASLVAGSDGWLARINRSGYEMWARQFGTPDTDFVNSLASDNAGGVFIAGSTTGDLGGPNSGFSSLDAWLARYDGFGSRTWIRQFGTIYTDDAYALCPDGTGGAFIGGSTGGALGGSNPGGQDAWLARYALPLCPADFNSDSSVDFFDYLDFVAAFDTGTNKADFNGDGEVDFFDYLDFVSAWDLGC